MKKSIIRISRLDDRRLNVFGTLLGKPPRTMNRDHEGICITRNNKILPKKRL